MSTTIHPSVQAARATKVSKDLVLAILAAMDKVASGDADGGRATLASLRAEHGSAAFQVAQWSAIRARS